MKFQEYLKEYNLSEATYKAGSGGELGGLMNVLSGWATDLKAMIGYENYDGALKLVKNLKTKVLVDIEKELKKLK